MSKIFTKKDEENRLCLEWLKDPLMNPETGRPIEKDGPKYNEFKARCRKLGISDRPVATGVMTWRKCQEWRRSPGINPETGRKLAINGDKYKSIEKQCSSIEKELHMKLLGEYPKPDKYGLVPAHLENSIFYIIRNYQSRPVYGPLNRFSNKICNIYFKDTWDYKYNHYRPVFIGMKEPERQNIPRNLSKTKHEDPKYVVDKILNLFM